MEYNNSKEKEIVVDIESGGTSGVLDTISSSVLGKKRGKKLLNKLTGGVLGYNGSTNDESTVKLGSKDSHETVELLIDKGPGGRQRQELLPLVEKKHEKERRKIGKFKKAAKPPRPPKGPSLDAADMKLVKEISELAIKKRERVERMNALRKMKAAKSSPSSSSTISAMVITILFLLVLIFQGLSSRKDLTGTFPGAPEPAIETKSLISIEFYHRAIAKDSSGPSLQSQKSEEQIPGSGLRPLR